MAKNITIIKNCKKSSFLIGDSKMFGNNQIISGEIKYNNQGLFDEHNKKVLARAQETASKEGFFNVRVVTCYYDGIAISCGIIDFKKTRETIKPFKF